MYLHSRQEAAAHIKKIEAEKN